jgi:hypothetical protein
MSLIDSEPSPILKDRYRATCRAVERSLRKSARLRGWLDPISSLDFLHEGDELAKRRYIKEFHEQIEIDLDYEGALFRGEHKPLFPELHEYKPTYFYDWALNDPELNPRHDSSVDEGVFAVTALRLVPHDQIARQHVPQSNQTA